MSGMPSHPSVISEEIPFDKEQSPTELELLRPMGGVFWWNSLFWTNFPPLACFDERMCQGNSRAGFIQTISGVNSDTKLSEQYVSFGAAREDLCTRKPVPKDKFTFTVECMQYEGVRDSKWRFPLQGYIPNRDNHCPPEIQARRFEDNGVLHLGINAEEFSAKIQPVGDLDACITIADYVGNPTWGYYHALLKIGGWPFRIKKIGTFEGQGAGGFFELNIGLHWFHNETLWNLLEGSPSMAPTGPNGEMETQGNLRVGYKYYCQILDLDWLGYKSDESKYFDPEIPPEKGYIWFKVVESVTLPNTGSKAVKIKLLDEGIVPAWLDLNFMEAFVGSQSLGFFNELECSAPPVGSANVYRTVEPNSRKVVIKNGASKLVFHDPFTLPINDFCDMGWAIMDCGYRGDTIMKFGSTAGKWAVNVGDDEGLVGHKSAGPPPLAYGDGPQQVLIQAPKSACGYERRLVM